MQTLIFVVLIVLFGSALFSCVEAALFSVSLGRARVLAEQKKRGSANLIKVKENIRRPITVIVILNNIFNIAGSIMVGAMAGQVLGNAWVGVISAVLTFLIIILGEIIPKTLGENYAEPISLFAAGPLLASTKLFSPFIWFIEKLTSPFSQKNKTVSEEEIRILSHLGHLEGSIEKDEKEMIQKVFRLNDLTAENIMTPRTVVEALEYDKTLDESEDEIYDLNHSRLPVFKEDLDDIVGIVHQRNLLIAIGRDQGKKKISDFEEPPIYVSEKMKADELLPFFQKRRCHLAIVRDEFGGTSGVVTLEDVLEQLVGEIVDETDEEIDMRIKARKMK